MRSLKQGVRAVANIEVFGACNMGTLPVYASALSSVLGARSRCCITLLLYLALYMYFVQLLLLSWFHVSWSRDVCP